jgi:hypothetical protein
MTDLKGDYIECCEWAGDIKLSYRVYDVSEFPRGKDGTCAFCQGDPCADLGEGLIALYFEANKSWATTCPVCDGRPT